jgi:molybdopterin molybdotransferase
MQFAFPCSSPYHFLMAGPVESKVVSFEEARRVVEERSCRLGPQGRELVSLLEAAGRVLAEPIVADRDFPPFSRATRDGYAVRSRDLESLPADLDVVGEVKAGGSSGEAEPLEPGKAYAIMTGAPVPVGADAVVMLEHTVRSGQRIQLARSLTAGENLVPRGAEAEAGQQLLNSGSLLDPAAIALAAAVGKAHLWVFGKTRVAVLATGDELVEVDREPGPNQIRNSNSYSLAAQILATGAVPVQLPIAPDEPQRLRELLREGMESDLLLISGGVSLGKYDLVEQELAELGAEFFFTGAQIQPGRPIVFGQFHRQPGEKPRHFFGLPGNPISTMVTYELFARPMVEALTGRQPAQLRFVYARLKTEIRTKTGLRRFLPAKLSGEFEHAEVELVRWQGSGDAAALARANAYLVIAPDQERIAAGEWVPIVLR